MKIDSKVCKEKVELVFGRSDWKRLRKFKDAQHRVIREFVDGAGQIATVITGRGDQEFLTVGKGLLAEQPVEHTQDPGLSARHKIRIEYTAYDNDMLDKLLSPFESGYRRIEVIMDREADNPEKRTFEFVHMPIVITSRKISKDGEKVGYYEIETDCDPKDFICMLLCIEQCAGCGHGLSIDVSVGGTLEEELGFDGDGTDSIQSITLDGRQVDESYAPYNYEETMG